MTVITASLKKDGAKYALLPDGSSCKHFKINEFRCKDGSDTILYSPETVAVLEKIREHFGGKSVNINSAYRTPAYNKKVGGAPASQHVLGTACDIVIKGITPLQIAQYAEGSKVTGIGLYTNFTHVDTRAKQSFWDQRSGKQVVVSTFGGVKPPVPPSGEPMHDADISVMEQAKDIVNQLKQHIQIDNADNLAKSLFDNYNKPVWWAMKKLLEEKKK